MREVHSPPTVLAKWILQILRYLEAETELEAHIWAVSPTHGYFKTYEYEGQTLSELEDRDDF